MTVGEEKVRIGSSKESVLFDDRLLQIAKSLLAKFNQIQPVHSINF